MVPRLSAEPIESIPTDAAVAHYDELSDPAKRTLFEHRTGDRPAQLDGPLSDEFGRWDVVKFTDYLAVSVDCPA